MAEPVNRPLQMLLERYRPSMTLINTSPPVAPFSTNLLNFYRDIVVSCDLRDGRRRKGRPSTEADVVRGRSSSVQSIFD